MKKYLTVIIIFVLSSTACKKGFLDKPPVSDFTDDNFWTSEAAIRTFAFGFYPTYFSGYGAGWAWGLYFTGQSFNDDYGPTAPGLFPVTVPNSGGGWDFTMVRRSNIFVSRLADAPIPEEQQKHWLGVARFFRGMAYFNLVATFGDIPWFDEALPASDTTKLYRPRDPRTVVMTNVLEDFKYAAENVLDTDDATGPRGLIVNKWVVLAYMSRVFLFEGTWEKYHNTPNSKSTEFLEAAKWAANEIITNGGYSFNKNYRESFNALDLSGNTEMILYKKYDGGQTTHTLVSYSNREGQTGMYKRYIDSYLCSDGLPISISGLYAGDKTGMADLLKNRDFRLQETLFPAYRPTGFRGLPAPYTQLGFSTTAFAQFKYLNEEIMNDGRGLSLNNPTDAPVIRYGEVLLNYAEACLELGNLTQDDLDKSINLLRSRPGSNMPKLQVMANMPAVNGVIYEDPARDPDVPSLTWEIRRERRVEFSMEGMRYHDIRRWKKFSYMDMQQYPDINLGAWIKKSDYPTLSSNVQLDRDGDEGYIKPATMLRTFDEEADVKQYLAPIPLDQIKLYKDNGAELTQNPGWEN